MKHPSERYLYFWDYYNAHCIRGNIVTNKAKRYYSNGNIQETQYNTDRWSSGANLAASPITYEEFINFITNGIKPSCACQG